VKDDNNSWDESPEEVERAILDGLHYLEHEAVAVELSSLARIIRRAVRIYQRVTDSRV
jgi:hypothetical protein